MKKVFLISAILLQFFAQAQEVKVLSLKEAINYALQNKIEAKKAQLDVENSEYLIQEVRSRALPQISVNGALNYNPIVQETALPGEVFGQPGTTVIIPFGQEWSSTGTVSVTQALFDYSVFTGLKAAKSTREFYKVNKELTDEQVIERVASAYYQIYIQKQKLTIIDSTINNTTRVKNIIKGQYENGLAKKIDLDRTTVKLSNIISQRQQIVSAVEQQENSLKFLIGMPIQTNIELPEADLKAPAVLLPETPDMSKRTEYRLLKQQEELLNYERKSIVATYYPTLSLAGNYGYQGQGREFPLGGKPADGVYWSDFATLGLNLRIPIFTGFATRSRVRQSDIKLKKVLADLEDTQLGLDLAYNNAKARIENTLITIDSQKENVDLAQLVLDNTRNNYQQGLTPLTDLLDAENALTDAKNSYSNSLLEYKLAEIQLIKSQGELKTLLN
ncbi:TolC family protein [Flavobacterium ardleyense]|uniref:TolC family protein n=1 Tax=Flavobacterium ardleyense TaxID=2038737 RepID=UPI00298D519A|nr:TolC family protein [Flavobacterium ardleyense]